VSTKVVICTLLVCDDCGEAYHNGEFTPHYDDATDARDEAADCAEWWSDRKGADLCYGCKRKPHTFIASENYPDECGRCGVEKDEHDKAPVEVSDAR